MNIQSINASIKYNNNYKNTANHIANFHTKPMEFDKVELGKASKIPFKGIEEGYYLLQAGRLKKTSDGALSSGFRIYSESLSLIDASKKAQKGSESILQASEILFNDVCNLVLLGKKNHLRPINDKNGKVAIDFYFDENHDLTIDEYDRKGNIGRKTIILENSIISIEMGENEDGYEAYRFDKKTGKLTDYYFDFEYEDVQEEYNSDKHFSFKNGSLVSFDKDYQRKLRGSEKSSEHINYNNGKLVSYSLGWKQNKNNSEIASGLYMFGANGLNRYYENILSQNNSCKSADCMYRYNKNGELIRYGKGLNSDNFENANHTNLYIEFDNETPKRIWQNRIHSKENGELSSSFIYEYDLDGRAEKCLQDFIKEKDEEATTREIIFSEEDEDADIQN